MPDSSGWHRLPQNGKQYKWSPTQGFYVFGDGSRVPQDQLPASQRNPPVVHNASSPSAAAPSQPRPIISYTHGAPVQQPKPPLKDDAVAGGLNSKAVRGPVLSTSVPTNANTFLPTNSGSVGSGNRTQHSPQSERPVGNAQAVISNLGGARVAPRAGGGSTGAKNIPTNQTLVAADKVPVASNDRKNSSAGQPQRSANNPVATQSTYQNQGSPSDSAGQSKTVVATDPTLGVHQTWHFPAENSREKNKDASDRAPTVVDAVSGNHRPKGYTTGLQDPGIEFGTVLETLLVAPPGSDTTITATPTYKDSARPQRYVVISPPSAEHRHSYWALKISTYQGHGVAYPGVMKGEHAIIYITVEPPPRSEDELPQGTEDGLLPQAIRVEPAIYGFAMSPMSRLNFGAIHDFELGVSIRIVGRVVGHSRDYLTYQFKMVWRHRTKFITQRHTMNPSASTESTTSDGRTIVPPSSSAGTVVNFTGCDPLDRTTSRAGDGILRSLLDAAQNSQRLPINAPGPQTGSLQNPTGNVQYSQSPGTQSTSVPSRTVHGLARSRPAETAPQGMGGHYALPHRPVQSQEYTGEDFDRQMRTLIAQSEQNNLPPPTIRDENHRQYLIANESARTEYFENVRNAWRRILDQRAAANAQSKGKRK